MSLSVSYATGNAIETASQVNARNAAINDLSFAARLTGAGVMDGMAAGTTYQAATDGIVIVTSFQKGIGNASAQGFTDASNPPTTEMMRFTVIAATATEVFACFPVKAGNYYKVTVIGNALHIFFCPLSGGASLGLPVNYTAGEIESATAVNTRNTTINALALGTPASKSVDTLYQAATQGFVLFSNATSHDVTGYALGTDNSGNWGARADDDTPSYDAMPDGYLCETDSIGGNGQLFFPVPKNWYYMIRKNTGSGSGAYSMWFIPHGS